MFVFGQLFIALAKLVNMVCSIFYFVLVIRIIMSWVNPDPYNEIVRTIYRITDPVLIPLRRLPLQFGAVDFSPIVAFLLLQFVSSFVVNVLMTIGRTLL